MSELIEAAKAGDQARVREILRVTPAAADQRESTGESALTAALYRGHRDLANEIADAQLEAGGSLDVFAAAALGRTDQLARALSDPAAVSAFAYDGWTALHLAAFFGHLDATARLLEAGASLAAVSRNSLTNTPLHIAAEAGYLTVVESLLARGADPHAVDAEDRTPLSRAAARNHAAVVDAMNVK